MKCQLQPSDRIKFFVHPDGSVVILPKIPTSKLKGIIKARHSVSLDDMDAAVSDGAISGGPRHTKRP